MCVREDERSTRRSPPQRLVGVYGVVHDVLSSDAMVSYDQQADQSTPARDYQ